MHNFELHTMKNPQIPFIFHTDTVTSQPVKVCNWHENPELISVIEGEGYAVVGEERLSLSPGDIAVINPNRLHGFYAADEGKRQMRYRCLILDTSFLRENHFDVALIFEKKIRDERLFSLLEQFCGYWEASEAASPWRVQHLRALAMEILILLSERYAAEDSSPWRESRAMASVKQALGFIRAECHRDLSLDEIALFVGKSKYYLAREFRRITGYSFVSYLHAFRCEKAKQLLTKGTEGVGEIGVLCGFPNASYFTQTFREQVGCTPSQYRRRQTAGKTGDAAL